MARQSRSGAVRAAGAAGAALLTLLATQASAQEAGEDIVFTLDRDNFSSGREVLLHYDFNCDNQGLGPVDVEDDGAGGLAFTVAPLNLPTVGCGPVPNASWNLKHLYTLSPGDYTLTVRQPGGDQVFTFSVRDSVLDSGPAQSGSWFDPTQGGQGLNLELFSDGRAIAYWYAYDAEGDNLWLFGDGRFDGDQIAFDVFAASGDGFPPDYDPESHDLEPWGDMTLTLETCRTGTLSWTTTRDDFEDGTLPLQRLSPPNGQPCFDDDLDADGWRTVNLLAEDPELDFELLNAGFNGSEEGGDWDLAFEDLPAALGEGRALTARVPADDEFARFFLATRFAGSGRLEVLDRRLHPPYAVLAEVTVALPGNLACEELNALTLTISFMDSLWDSASEEEQQPLSDVLFRNHTTLPLGGVGALRNDDCSNVDDFLVRTFVSPAVRTPFNTGWAMLTVDLNNLDPGSDEAVEGPVYLLDFRVRGREVAP